MKIKYFLGVALFLSVVFFGFAGSTKALTESETQALISQLQTQIAQLQAQIQTLLSQTQTSTTSAPTWCYDFKTNLGYANSGSFDVMHLHIALDHENILYGADKDKEFTEDTSAGVARFQAKYGITQTGFVGTLTRAKLNSLYSCFLNTTPTDVNPTPPECVPNWQCVWGECENGYQSQVAQDLNNCGLRSMTSIACTALARQCAQSTCVPNYTCGNWGLCSPYGQQTKTCTNQCTDAIRTEVQACTPQNVCAVEPQCGTWSSCINGTQTRSCNSGCTSELYNETRVCSPVCSPTMECGEWSACVNGSQIKSCVNRGCAADGTQTMSAGVQTQVCTPSNCTPTTTYGEWGYCMDGQQMREVHRTYPVGCPVPSVVNQEVQTRECTSACVRSTKCGAWGVCSRGYQNRQCITGYPSSCGIEVPDYITTESQACSTSMPECAHSSVWTCQHVTSGAYNPDSVPVCGCAPTCQSGQWWWVSADTGTWPDGSPKGTFQCYSGPPPA